MLLCVRYRWAPINRGECRRKSKPLYNLTRKIPGCPKKISLVIDQQCSTWSSIHITLICISFSKYSTASKLMDLKIICGPHNPPPPPLPLPSFPGNTQRGRTLFQIIFSHVSHFSHVWLFTLFCTQEHFVWDRSPDYRFTCNKCLPVYESCTQIKRDKMIMY